jgi:hypothetical protein
LAAPVTNACLSGATATYSDIAVNLTGTASPDPATVGQTVTLSGTSAAVDVPGTLFLAGYRLGLLQLGSNTIPADGEVKVSASNTSQHDATKTVSASPTVTITDPTPANKASGDESASALSVNLPLGDTTWTATGGTIEFREVSVTINAVINNAIPVTLTCQPGTSSTDGTTFTPSTPAPFETVSLGAAGTTTTTAGGATTTTTTGGTTTTTTGGGSTTTTLAGSTTTTTRAATTTVTSTTSTTSTTGATANHLPGGRVQMVYDCRGADAASQGVLDTLGSLSNPPAPPPNHLQLGVALSTDPITSPAQGASFQLPVRWAVSLPDAVVKAATALKITSVPVSGVSLSAGPVSGATGPDLTFRPPDQTVNLATNPGFSAGPALGTFTRTGKVGDAVVLAAKEVRLTARVNLGASPLVISLLCDPPATRTLSVVDSAGSAPLATPTASVLGASVTRPASTSLARTGAPIWAYLALAVVLIDLGYLSVSATWTRKRRIAAG